MMGTGDGGKPSWSWRRAIIFPVCVWCLWRLSFMENGPDTRVNETIAWGYLILVMVLVLGYSGFATVQDLMAIWATKSGRPYQQQMQPATPPRVGKSIPDPAADQNKPPEGMAL